MSDHEIGLSWLQGEPTPDPPARTIQGEILGWQSPTFDMQAEGDIRTILMIAIPTSAGLPPHRMPVTLTVEGEAP